MTEPVADVVTRVLDGRLSSAAALDMLSRMPEDDQAEFLFDRHNEMAALTDRIAREPSSVRVAAMTELAVAAANPLGAPAVAQVLLLSATTLIDMDSDKRTALGYLDRAMPLLDDFPDQYLIAQRMRLMLLVDMADHSTFDADSPAVLALAQERNERRDLCLMLFDKARSLAARGRVAEALSTARTALDERKALTGKESEYPPALSSHLHDVAAIAKQAGQFHDALALLEEARAAAIAEGSPGFAAFVLSKIGFTWALLADQQRADQVLVQAAAEAKRLGRTDWVAHWTHDPSANTANIVSGQQAWALATDLLTTDAGRTDEAITLLRECIAEATHTNNGYWEANARSNLGFAHVRANRPAQGELAFRVAVMVAHRIGDTMLEMTFRTNLSAALMTRGHVREALVEIEPALTLGERLRANTTSTELRQSVSAALARCYDVATFAAAITWRPGKWMIDAGSDPQPKVLIELGQRAKAANLMQALRIDAVVGTRDDPALVAAMLGLRAADIEVELAAAEGSDLGPHLAARNDAARRLTAVHGSDLVQDAPVVGMTELAAGLGDGEVLVDLQTTPGGVAVCCVTTDRATAGFFNLARAERYRLLRRLRRTRREYLADPCAETERELAMALAALDEALLTDVADMVRDVAGERVRRLFVCPENELFLIPFWRLANAVGDIAVSVLPTSGALPLLRGRQRGGTGERLWFADPSQTLPYSTMDVPADLGYLSGKATPSELAARLPGASRVHFSCHGYFNARSAHRSGLLVSADDGPIDPLGAPDPEGRAELSLYTAAQIAGRLYLPRCELVVLSACDSGLPRDHDASEFTSLPGAFLVAGARDVVASLWPAYDGAAAILMNEFYRRCDIDGVAAALAAARTTIGTLSREDAMARLDTTDIPPGDRPFASPVYTDCFQHYGVD